MIPEESDMRRNAPKTRSPHRFLTALGAAACFIAGLCAPAALAQPADRHGNAGSYDDINTGQDEIHQTVARVSFTAGENSFSRGDDPDTWQVLNANVPMTQGDRVATADGGRLELQLTGGNYLRLDAQSDLTALSLTDETKQFSLSVGTASFLVRGLADTEIFEVDTPNAAVTFERAGDYRIDVDADGNTRVAVRRGRAAVAAAGGEVSLDPGEEMDIQGLNEPEYDIVPMAARDRFDEWTGTREQRISRSRSNQYVSPDVAGREDLDEYGRWVALPGYGTVWTPTTVAADWRPYYDGHWIWQDPWGWTWVAAEPWGWAPYHYGRWVFNRAHWYWVPVGPMVTRVSYAPALVAFVGGGPGWSVSVSVGGGGYVGWFPLAPADPFVPWWGSRSRVVTRTTNVTYVNRTYVTVVNQNTFISGNLVRTNAVRDRTIVHEVSVAQVAQGPIPLAPTRASLRGNVQSGPAKAPRTALTVRPVVVRTPPPPAPVPFDRKAAIIRDGRGTPVSTSVEAKITVEDRQAERARVAVRPVTVEPGVVKLKPKRQGGETKSARPVEPQRGRPVATPERLVEPLSPPGEAPGKRQAPPGQSRGPAEKQSPAQGGPQQEASPNTAPGQAPQPPAPGAAAPTPPAAAGKPGAQKPAADTKDSKAQTGKGKDKGKSGKGDKKEGTQDSSQDGTQDSSQDGTAHPK